MLNDQQLATTIVSAVWSLTVCGDSGPGVDPSCRGTAIIDSDDETGGKIGGNTVDTSIVVNIVVGA
jgi:hypothetical protein